MKSINIQSLLQANVSLEKNVFEGFVKHYGIEIRDAELVDMMDLVVCVKALQPSIKVFDKFYVGYKIPQIGKEFDLLRFSEDSIINIEIKRKCTVEEIRKQLIRNKYYLSFIGREVYSFSFISDSKELYFLTSKSEIEKTTFEVLVKLLNQQMANDSEIIDELFNPSDYLVSPFNTTRKFLNNEYFLTHQQEELKTKVIESLNSSEIAKFISITGGAGTGKTLLIYDIAKQLKEKGKKALIIHCGYLNDGQEELRSNGWEITPIKHYSQAQFIDYDLVIIDEAQRLRSYQLNEFIEKIKVNKGRCLFSYDKLQTLANWEEERDISAQINSIESIVKYKLSDKIRTNKEIAVFIKMLFNRNRVLTITNKNNIEINYFNSTKDAKSYLEILDGSQWEIDLPSFPRTV